MTNEIFSLGVEEEFQIVSAASNELIGGIEKILAAFAPACPQQPKREMHQCMVEMATPVCRDVHALRRAVVANRRALAQAARGSGFGLIAAGTHPCASWQDQNITDDPYFQDLVAVLKEAGQANLIFGFHVHVGVADLERAVDVFNVLRFFLPLFLALSTSSPFREGRCTGLLSSRQLTWCRLPRTGVPGVFRHWREYRRYVDSLVDFRGLPRRQAVWWDLRLHETFSTIELRACDQPTRVRDVVAIAALFQALVATLMKSRATLAPYGEVRTEVIEDNKWQAARFGIDALMIDPVRRRRISVREMVDELMLLVAGTAEDLGSAETLADLRQVVACGTSAHRQVRAYEQSPGNWTEVLALLRRETLDEVIDAAVPV